MDDDGQTRLWLIVSVVGVVFLALSLRYLHVSSGTSQKPPTVATRLLPMISDCKEVAPGMRRIGAHPGDRYMLQFDVPVKSVSVHEGAADAPPFTHGFGIKPQAGRESYLEISYGPQRNWPDVDRKRAASERVVKRIIVDDQGHSVGEDDWGYLDLERRWRSISRIGPSRIWICQREGRLSLRRDHQVSMPPAVPEFVDIMLENDGVQRRRQRSDWSISL